MAAVTPNSGPIPFNPALRAYAAPAARPAAPFAAPSSAASRAAGTADRLDLSSRAFAPAPAARSAPPIPKAPAVEIPSLPSDKVQNLVAARLPTGIDFTSGPEPRPAATPLEAARAAAQPQAPSVTGATLLMQLYRHPADKVQAATDVAVGRILDKLA